MKLGENNGNDINIIEDIEPSERNKENWIEKIGKRTIYYGEIPTYHGKI